MKNLTNLMLGAAIGSLSLSAAQAGPTAYDSKKQVIEDCTVPFTGAVSFGYESDYIFRGLNSGSNAFWGSAAANFAVGSNMSLDIGTWYINPTNVGDFFNDPGNVGDELDVYAFLNFAVKGIDASLGFTAYAFPELNSVVHGRRDTWETSLGLSKDLGFFEVGAFIAYDFELNDGWYYEIRGNKTIAVRDCLDLNLGLGIAYSDNGVLGINDWTHAYSRIGLAWHMTESATFNLYSGYNWMLDGMNDVVGAFQEDEIHWGTSVGVTF